MRKITQRLFLLAAVLLLALPLTAIAGEHHHPQVADATVIVHGTNLKMSAGCNGLWLLSGEDVLYLPDTSTETQRVGSAKGVTHLYAETDKQGIRRLPDGTISAEGEGTLWLITEAAGQQALIGLSPEGKLVYRNWLPEGFFVHEFGVCAGQVYLLGTPEPPTGKGLPQDMALYVSQLAEELQFSPFTVNGWKNTRVSHMDLRDNILYVERLMTYYAIDLENRTCVADRKETAVHMSYQGQKDGANFWIYSPGYMCIERTNMVTGWVTTVVQKPPRDTIWLALTDNALYGLHGSCQKVYRLANFQ